ncbi:hypothetical protein BDV95DRAFT_580993 [Massariosphaeria phaeospora]|uniref:Uncharacterized protein n=1 Tax=Massariosphaeria phaeospora TaxID=100035 RepID=A0A7C8M2C6_9PLEO|nr:hypothetical protein BDV95DRAFT_580993 [Massariosphaeria phaeospora]
MTNRPTHLAVRHGLSTAGPGPYTAVLRHHRAGLTPRARPHRTHWCSDCSCCAVGSRASSLRIGQSDRAGKAPFHHDDCSQSCVGWSGQAVEQLATVLCHPLSRSLVGQSRDLAMVLTVMLGLFVPSPLCGLPGPGQQLLVVPESSGPMSWIRFGVSVNSTLAGLVVGGRAYHATARPWFSKPSACSVTGSFGITIACVTVPRKFFDGTNVTPLPYLSSESAYCSVFVLTQRWWSVVALLKAQSLRSIPERVGVVCSHLVSVPWHLRGRDNQVW